MSKEVAEEYASSLADLTVNSKPLINMLTILAEENIDHAGVIVETVEKHLEKVHPDIKLPVLYLVDSIIKNVGGAYTQKFSQSIVNMFTRTFKQVDEKIRSQMFKLRETWHDVFPATKLYQLDVKVNLIDPAWPIQAQPQQSNIHVNPNFLKKTTATTSTTVTPAAVVPAEEDEKMRNILAKKEQELLMLQRKKVEMELEQMRRQVELAEKTVTKKVPGTGPTNVNAVNMAAPTPAPAAALLPEGTTNISAKQRLGPPVPKSTGRIAPVSASLASARRDPRLARLQQAAGAVSAAPSPPVAVVAPAAAPLAPIAPNVFDIKPLERVTKRKNVITIDVRQDAEPARPATRDPRRRDPRLEKRDPRRTRPREERERRREELRRAESERNHTDTKPEAERNPMPAYVDKLPDPKKISKMPPIPKITRPEVKRDSEAVPAKRKRDNVRTERRRRREELAQKEGERAKAAAAAPAVSAASAVAPAADKKRASPELVAFKELRNYHKEHYMRRNRDKSASPEHAESGAEGAVSSEPPSVPEIISETKDVDLRVLPAVVTEAKAASVGQKRSSTETAEVKAKKTKIDKFDVLFGNEDVDLRQLPQVDEVNAPPPPSITGSPKSDSKVDDDVPMVSPPKGSPKRDWNEIKKREKTPSKLDLVRAKFAEVTKGKDRLGRPLLFSKSPSIERERRRTLSSEDTDLREDDEQGFVENKKSISIIMSQAKEHFTDGQLDKNQYNTLMYQILQLNEKLKLKEAKQRESLEISKRKLKATIEENHKVPSPKSSPNERNRFGDIDERITPSVFLDTPPDSQGMLGQDSDMRLGAEALDMKTKGLLPIPPMMPMFGPYQQQMPWRGPRPRAGEEFGPRRFRGPMPPYFRAGKFDKRAGRPPFDPRMAMPPLPTPKIGMCQGECPLTPYERSESPPPLGAPGFAIPPTDFKVIEYIDQDPFKTIQIDGIPREIRFYGNTAVIMLDWDDPREIKFLPGCRRVTFDNKDSVVLTFNEGYKQVEFDDQVFDIKFGAPTRELYINGRWYECFFGGQPLGVIIDGKPRLVHLEGPMPQVDIGKAKRTDLVAGKINLIVNATQMHPVYLDAKVQKILVNGQYLTVRFVDSLRTVLINEQPFKVEFGGLPKPIVVGSEKYFVRFSALPRNIKPGHVQIANMEGIGLPLVPPVKKVDDLKKESENPMEVDQQQPIARPVKTPSPELNPESLGLDMLASVMPSSTVPASGSEYSVAEPLFSKTDKIPGLETPMEEKPAPVLPLIGNINVNDLFAKLVATGIVQVPITTQPEPQDEAKSKPEEVKNKTKEDKNIIHKVDFMKSETFRVKQPGLVAKLYGGMQCSGCGARFPPEHTVRYSQHLDWHFRQNRRDRDSARRAHSRHWHYDLSDWVQYEEVEDLEEREKSWFETGGNPAVSGEGAVEPPAPAPLATPSAAASAPASHCCALCGDMFQQFYNEDKEEWHLRNAIKHNDDYYHPLCFEDYKTSLTKAEEPKVKESSDDVATEEKTEEEAIEIKDVDETAEQSDNESVVEVVEDPRDLDPVEIDEEEDDEDDVVFKAEPVVQVVVEDDVDTDDELTAERAERDRLAEIDFTKIKVKQEPIDPDDEPILTAEEETIQARIDHTHPTVESSIDGNLQLDAASIPTASIPIGGIRINISKSLPSFVNNQNQEDKMLEDVSADDEPLPPGEEPELEYTLKPALEGVQFSRQPPVNKGNELSGLCSIM